MSFTKRTKLDFKLDVVLTKSVLKAWDGKTPEKEEIWKAECPTLGKVAYGRTEKVAVDGLKMAVADTLHRKASGPING